MQPNIMEKILKELLLYYLGLDDIQLDKCLKESNLATKEKVESIDIISINIIYRCYSV